MSADLFAAFGDTEVPKSETNAGAYAVAAQVSEAHPPALQPVPAEAQLQDDDFGDFEGENPWTDDYLDSESQEPRLEPEANKDNVQWAEHAPSAVSGGSDVLFDASNSSTTFEAPSNDDDFGDFEGSPIIPNVPEHKVSPPLAQVTDRTSAKVSMQPSLPLPNAADLLGLEASPTAAPNSIPKGSTHRATRPTNPVKHTKKPAASTAIVMALSADSWDDFETTTPEQTPSVAPTNGAIAVPDLLSSMRLPPPSPAPLPPANIPPPSVILPLFPPLLSQISAFLSQLSALPIEERALQLASPPLLTLLQSHLALLQTLAHIIAARKLRWRRDKRLAQSMSIGPSVSGRSGGMKLAGLDKGEQGREEVHVREVVRAYKSHVGVLRGVVGQVTASAAPASSAERKSKESKRGLGDLAELLAVDESAPSHGPKVSSERLAVRILPPIPEIGEMLPVRTATKGEGAVSSTQACGLCGMKREERVQKVDTTVEDSFGEWWIEGTNLHTGCWRFWEGQKEKLLQR